MSIVYVGLDLGSSNFQQVALNHDGVSRVNRDFTTSEANLVKAFSDLKGITPPTRRREFKTLVQHYDELTAQQARLKTRIKGRLRIVIAKPITLWAGAESLNKLVDRDEETLSSPVQWLGPHRTAKAQPNHRPRTSVSLTYPNGCKAKTKRSLKGG